MIEILQMVWNSLTTENVMLTNIVIIPLSFIEAYISMLLFTTILNISSTKKQKFIYFAIASILAIITRSIIPDPYNTYINIIGIFVLIKLIFKSNVIKSLLALFVPFVFSIIIELFLSKIYTLIFNFDYTIGINIPINRLCVTLIIYFIEFVFVCFVHGVSTCYSSWNY